MSGPLTAADAGAVLALDVGGTRIKAGVLGPDGAWLCHESRPTGAEQGPDAVIENVLRCAAELTRAHRPLATGIVVPGIVDEAAGIAVFAANLGWRELPVADWLAEELGLPVAFGHDVRAGGLAEARLGAGRGCRNLVFVPVGTGVAAAAVFDGRVVAGGHGGAGELGHLSVRPDGPACACGNRGCVEHFASASAVARRYGEAVAEAGVTAEEVLRRAGAGDATAAAVVQEAVDALADGLVAAITLLDPQRIVVGGGLAEAGDVYLRPLRAALAARLTFQTAPSVVPAALGHRAGCLGAALLARNLLLSRRVTPHRAPRVAASRTPGQVALRARRKAG